MAALRTYFDDPRWPLAFVLLIVTITVAALVAHRGRRVAVPTRERDPWSVGTPPPAPALPAPVPTHVLPVAAPAVVVPAPRAPLAVPPPPRAARPADPVGTVVLAVSGSGSPDGTAVTARLDGLLQARPGLHLRVRRADLALPALVDALPDDAAALLDDLTAAPADAARNSAFRRAVDAAALRLPCAVLLAGPSTPPVVAVTTLDLRGLLADNPVLTALLARATAVGAGQAEQGRFDTALLAAARARPVGAVVDLDGLRTDRPWVAASRERLCADYGALLGT